MPSTVWVTSLDMGDNMSHEIGDKSQHPYCELYASWPKPKRILAKKILAPYWRVSIWVTKWVTILITHIVNRMHLGQNKKSLGKNVLTKKVLAQCRWRFSIWVTIWVRRCCAFLRFLMLWRLSAMFRFFMFSVSALKHACTHATMVALTHTHVHTPGLSRKSRLSIKQGILCMQTQINLRRVWSEWVPRWQQQA